jgi:hypothetical protein
MPVVRRWQAVPDTVCGPAHGALRELTSETDRRITKVRVGTLGCGKVCTCPELYNITASVAAIR